MKYRAHLSDPIHGETTKTAPTPEEAVELAFRELASSWMNKDDAKQWGNKPMFDGEIRTNGEVWYHNRAWGLIGTVQTVQDN